jgi:large repetitive protein
MPLKRKPRCMKKFITQTTAIICFFLLTCVNNSFSQVSARLDNRWFLGFNMGGTWQTNDVDKNLAGLAGGLTLGKYYLQNTNSPFDIGWRFRYLGGTTYGYDYTRSTGLKNNVVLNGTLDTSVNYTQQGYYYHNYRTKYGEVSLELMLGANKLRKRTGILLYVFGGAGGSEYRPLMDLLDGKGKMYDFSTVDSSGSQSPALDQLQAMYDGKYETPGEKHTDPQWHFMVSGGVGLGFMLGKHASLGFEYKVTLPFDDLLDGKQWTNNNTKTGTNDYYHYASGYLRFYLGGRNRSTGVDTIRRNNTTGNNNPDNFTASGNPPQVIIGFPAANPSPYPWNQQNIVVTGSVTNISYQSSIRVKLNGATHSNFTWDPNSKSISVNAMLIPGINTLEIRATNKFGADSKTVSINYTGPDMRPMPMVSFITPPDNPHVTNVPNTNVTAYIQHIENKSQLNVVFNGSNVSNYTYNAANGNLNFTTNNLQGTNILVVTATNAAGSDSKTLTISYQPTQIPDQGMKPIVTILNPGSNPFNATVSMVPVSASVLNVNSGNDITVMINNKTGVNFNYNAFNKTVTFNAGLMPGMNTVIITAKNNFGTDTKSVIINYIDQPKPMRPEVEFITPSNDPYTSVVAAMNVIARVSNVASKNEIQVTVNGNPVYNFGYNANSDQLNMALNLIQGSNVVTITATNNVGIDSRTTTILYNPAPAGPKPQITYLNPAVNPYTSPTQTIYVKATVLNVVNNSQIQVDLNGNPVTGFIYTASTKQLAFNANLIEGSNVVTITATNSNGTESKSTVITYKTTPKPGPQVIITNPAVNPLNTTVSPQMVMANVFNINSQNEISVTVNGQPFSGFTYSTSSKVLSMNVNLIQGANVISITASNANGTDGKNTTIMYSAQPKPAPQVVITSPISNPHVVSTPNATVTATVTNVASTNEISVTLNGQPYSGFSYNMGTKILTMSPSLNPGSNLVEITASNSNGSDSKNHTLVYQAAPKPAPIVTITSPITNPHVVTTASATVTGSVLNVAGANEISVVVNGTPFTGFSYNMGTKALSMNLTLNPGSNLVEIKAANANGMDSKSTTLVYQEGPKPKPQVVITLPASSPYTSLSANQQVTASVLNVASASEISVKVNGQPYSGFNYNTGTKVLSMTASLVSGANTVEISASNANGSDSKTTTIMYNPVQKPVVTIVNPASSPTMSPTQQTQVSASVLNVSGSNEIQVTVNGNPFTGFNYNTGTKMLSMNLTLVSGNNNVTITATNSAGSDSKNTLITFTPLEKPSVLITTPNTDPYTSANCNIYIIAAVTNISNQSGISVTMNGNNFPGFNFNAATGHVTINTVQNEGNNYTFVITATNSAGTDSKSITIQCPQRESKPTIKIITPNQNPFNMKGNCNVNIVADVGNISNKNQITIKHNGNNFTGFTFNPNSKKIHLNWTGTVPSTNVFLITATNSAGTASETVTFNCIKNEEVNTNTKPVITLLNPPSLPHTTSDASYEVKAKITNITGAGQVSVKASKQPVTGGTYDAASQTFTIIVNLNQGNNNLEITANNQAGFDTKLFSIVLTGGNREGGGNGKQKTPDKNGKDE